MSSTDIDVICGRLDERLKAIHAEVLEVKALAQATNGRVRDIEGWRGRVDGALVPVGIVAVAVVGAVAKLMIGG